MTDPCLSLLRDLVAIDSVNPSLVPGAAGEAQIAEAIAFHMRRIGLDVEMQEVTKGRPNVVGILEGTRAGRSLMLCGHTDTVGVEGMDAPFRPTESNGRLYGRGSQDMKGGVAAMIDAARLVRERGLEAGRLIIAAVVDEEFASVGADALVTQFAADAAVVTEPTDLRIGVAHKGFAWATIETRGRAAHGSRPDLGADAIVHMGAVLAEVSDLDRRLGDRDPHPLLGRGSVHASLIAGGQELSSYPERCALEIERRTLPGETAAAIEAEIADVVARARSREPALDASARVTLVREPFEIAPDAEIVRAVRAAGGAVTGREVEVVGHTAWMDAAILSAAGVPTVVFGPGGEGAHAVEEWVDLDSVEACADGLILAARELCG